VLGDESNEKSLSKRQQGAVINLLGRAILAGDYRPGDILPGEITYAKSLGISRGAVREAIQGLSAKGMVESRRKAGTRVTPRHRWSMLDPDVLAWAFAGDPDFSLLYSLAELRLANEPLAARLAARKRDNSQLSQLKASLDQIRSNAPSFRLIQVPVQEFHKVVLLSSKSDALIALAPAIATVVEWSMKLRQRSRILALNHISVYHAIYDGIALGDASLAETAAVSLASRDLDEIRLGINL
jgi:DNA-binding FadR family transcriptional regulator